MPNETFAVSAPPLQTPPDLPSTKAVGFPTPLLQDPPVAVDSDLACDKPSTACLAAPVWQAPTLNRLTQVCQTVQERHPLPRERMQTLGRYDVQRFLLELRRVTPKRLPYWIASLEAPQLACVFPAFLTTTDENTLNRLFLLVTQRASWPLYALGWLTVSQHFPETYTLRAFRLICHALRQQAVAPPRALPHPVVDEILQASDEGAFFDALLQPLLSCKASELASFCKRYALEPNSLLWQMLLGQYFRACPLADLVAGAPQLADLLPELHPQQAQAILARIQTEAGLTHAQRQTLAEAIFERLPILAPIHPFWRELDQRVLYQTYRRLAVQLRLQAHLGDNRLKTPFYTPHLLQIQDLARLAEGVLALRFPGFILVDDRRRMDRVLYYTDEAVEAFLSSGREQEALADPDFALPTLGIDEGVDTLLNEPGLILSLTGHGLQEAQILINQRLGLHRQNESRKRRR